MAKWWRSIDQTLKEEWESKLRESGFEDIEREVAGERVLKQFAGYPFRRKEHTQEVREIKLNYFSLIGEYVARELSFDDASDRLIMERTANGWTIQEISRELKWLKMPKYNRDTIRYIRRRYEHRWGIKFWKAEQMVSRRVVTR